MCVFKILMYKYCLDYYVHLFLDSSYPDVDQYENIYYYIGFVGDNCEIDIDECEILPCQNNATCQNLINDYSCICWPGYEGKNCSTDIQVNQ